MVNKRYWVRMTNESDWTYMTIPESVVCVLTEKGYQVIPYATKSRCWTIGHWCAGFVFRLMPLQMVMWLMVWAMRQRQKAYVQGGV